MKPKVIKNEKEHRAAIKRIEALWDAPAGSPQADELETWAILVESYENEKYPIEAADPVEAVKFRMEQLGLKPAQLAKILGSKSRVSEVLNRRRALSTAMMRNLYRDLKVPAESLLAEPKAKYGK
jgi:HTH-type transcriptional regulator/antitoxin HigA